MSELGVEIGWSPLLEDYFASTGEQAQCLSVLHKRAEELYSLRRTFIDLPVIVISSVTGFLSVGSSAMFEGEQRTSSTLLGLASLFVGVLNTMGAYFGWSKRAEGHRISSILYSKLYRYLSIEMSLPRDERMNASDLLKYTKDQYDRLVETSPLIPPEIIRSFRPTLAKYPDVRKPPDVNGLEKIDVYNPIQERPPGTPVLPRPPAALRQQALGSGLRRNTHLAQPSVEDTSIPELVVPTTVPTTPIVVNRTTDLETAVRPSE